MARVRQLVLKLRYRTVSSAFEAWLDVLAAAQTAAMVAEKAAARASTKEADPLKSPELVRKPSTGDVDPTIEKLQRDYRRARKEVSAAQLSKDQAKLKQEVSATCAAHCVS